MNIQRHKFAIDATLEQRAEVQAVINTASTWQSDLATTNDAASFYAMQAEVRLMQAVDRLWPDYLEDLIKERCDEIETQFGCDVDGRPVLREAL